MTKNRLDFALIFFLFFLMSCGTVGRNFNDSQIRSIQNNITSQIEILDRFGLPFKDGIENGQVIWTYQFDQWNFLGPAESKDLVILFDEKNIVTAYRFTTTESD